MAVLIPALGSCVSRMTPGVRRLAERLAHKRDSGYLLWHCVPTAPRNQQFSFKSVGIQAQGRTTALKTNYRNTKPILQTASLVAADRLRADDKDGDGFQLPKPTRCGREAEAPQINRLPTLRDEAFAMADGLGRARKEGHAWCDMAILCADYPTMGLCARALEQRRRPFNVRNRAGDFNPGTNAIQIMTMKVSKGLEFPVVALAARSGAYACGGGGREGSCAGVLCGGYEGYAQAVDYGQWRRRIQQAARILNKRGTTSDRQRAFNTTAFEKTCITPHICIFISFQ